MTSESVEVSLSKSQALVFFEWLTKQDENEALPFDHEAEQHVVWAIQSQLEKCLIEPFSESYLEVLEAARAQVTKPT